jgi:hypothetical protein
MVETITRLALSSDIRSLGRFDGILSVIMGRCSSDIDQTDHKRL